MNEFRPIYIATYKNFVTCVSVLIKHGVSVNEFYDDLQFGHGILPLHLALAEDCVETTELLLRYTDKDKLDGLVWKYCHSNEILIKMMLDYGLDPMLKFPVIDGGFGRSVLHLCSVDLPVILMQGCESYASFEHLFESYEKPSNLVLGGLSAHPQSIRQRIIYLVQRGIELNAYDEIYEDDENDDFEVPLNLVIMYAAEHWDVYLTVLQLGAEAQSCSSSTHTVLLSCKIFQLCGRLVLLNDLWYS